MTVRPPSQWADAQRAFHYAYEADPTLFPRTPVVFRWWTVRPSIAAGRTIAVFVAFWRIARGDDEGTFAALYRPEDPDGAPPFLMFDTETGTVPDECDAPVSAVAVGELVLNGALVLETATGLIWPIYNPRTPAPSAPSK